MAAFVDETRQNDEDLAATIARRGASERAFRAATDAFERLYRRHAPLLLAFIAARVPSSDCDDLHQEVWQRVWASLPENYQSNNLRAWLHQIARNAIIDLSRKKHALPLTDGETLVDGRDDDGRSRLLEQERKDALERCLKRLQGELADLVRARLAGESYSVICGRLGLRPEQAHKQFHLAKVQLKTCVESVLG